MKLMFWYIKPIIQGKLVLKAFKEIEIKGIKNSSQEIKNEQQKIKGLIKVKAKNSEIDKNIVERKNKS